MKIMQWKKVIIAGLLSTLAPLSTLQASALFDGTTADAWSINPQTGEVIGYDLGNNWLDQYVASDFDAIDLTNGKAVLINNLPNSSVPMTAGQAAISLSGIGARALTVAQASNNDLTISPQSGTYNDTIEVKILVSSEFLSQQNYQLLWTVDSQAQQSVELTTQSATQSLDGYFVQTLYLVADGSHSVTVLLKNSIGATVDSALANYTINTCVAPMDAQACADKLRRDTDGDGIPDLVELDIGLNPLANDSDADLNGDGWSEFDSWMRRLCIDPGTRQAQPGSSCLDDSGLPLDSDQDGWSDFDEILRATNYQDAEPILPNVPVAFPYQPASLPDMRFCSAGGRFYFNLAFQAAAADVSFGLGTTATPFTVPFETIGFNFDQTGQILYGIPPEVRTSTTQQPLVDHWQDGALDEFKLVAIRPGVWRMQGSMAKATDVFMPGEGPWLSIQDSISGPYEVSTNLADCLGSEASDQERLRYKDFPSATRLYEVEYVLNDASLVAPPAASLALDQQSLGTKQAEYAGVVVQSYTAAQDNIAAVYVALAADANNQQGYDDITLNIWGDSLRGTLLMSQTLKHALIDPQTDTTLGFVFEAIPQQPGQVYYLEFRQHTSKLVSTGLDSYANGSVVEADGVAISTAQDIKFITYSDSSFANGVAGTPDGMRWTKAVAASINGKQLYNSETLLSDSEITQASLLATDVSESRRADVAQAVLQANSLPSIRVPAGDSAVLSVTHRYDYRVTTSHQAPAGYQRNYKYWLPRVTDVSTQGMLSEVGPGNWTSADEWRQAFIDYLVPRLTVQSNPQINVDSSLAVNTIEAVLTEESYLQGSSQQQMFASLSQPAKADFAKQWEQSLSRFSLADFNLDQSITELSLLLSTGQPLSAQGDWLRTTFFAAQSGTRSDETIARRLHQSYDSSCFISDAELPALQADALQWNAWLDRCPDYFGDTELSQYQAADQLRRYQLRLLLLPDVSAALSTFPTLLTASQDSDADGLNNQAELELAVKDLTLPWVADGDGDGMPDGVDPCANDAYNECSLNPVLPVITLDSDLTISEPYAGSAVALVGIRLDRIYDQAITVSYEVTAGTATAGEDFTAFSGSVVIAPGQQSALVEIPIFADANIEGSESFSFSITATDKAVVGDDGIVVLTLYDPGLPVSIGGTVSGLSGNIVLQNNASDDLVVAADGSFSFATTIAQGSSYSVSILSQPVGQICTVSNFSAIASADVNDIVVNCSVNSASYSIGGTVSGLSGTVVLQNNNADDLSVLANGSFSFITSVPDGSSYDVTVLTQPSGQLCVPTSNTGSVSGGNVTSVVISCSALTAPDAPANVAVAATNPKTLTFSWDAAAGATSYRLLKNADGVSGYSVIAAVITQLSVDEVIPVHLHDWVNASYIVQACNAASCSDSLAITSTSAMVNAIGSFTATVTGSNDSFGYSIALSADASTIAVGAWNEDSNATTIDGDQNNNSASSAGAVYVFTRSAGSWVQQAYIKASNAEAGDYFGYDLDISADGDTLVVGAYGEDSSLSGINPLQTDNTATYAGAVYVFTRSLGSWSQQAYIKASNAAANDDFGFSVAISADGNTLAAGAYGEDSSASGVNGDQSMNNYSASGAAYVFTRSGTVWVQQAYIKASNTGISDAFGYELDLSANGDVLAVGAYNESSNATGIDGDQINNSATSAGAVYVLTRNLGSWSQQAYIKASNTNSSDGFGKVLTLSGDGLNLAVTALGESSNATGIDGDQSNNSLPSTGAVYMFTSNVGSWAQQAYIKASTTAQYESFGVSLALSDNGNILSVGVPPEDSNATGINGNQSDNSFSNSGAVYVFTRDITSWQQQAYVKASDTRADDRFGESVGLSADGLTLSVGATNGSLGSGAFYIY